MPARIAIDPDMIADFCRRNHIRKPALFGSVLRDDFTPESDVDVLADFDPEARVSLLDVVRMERELTDSLGRKADLLTAGDLSRYFRKEVVDSAEVLYEQAR
jgi:predicted nucleotidyltransferase